TLAAAQAPPRGPDVARRRRPWGDGSEYHHRCHFAGDEHGYEQILVSGMTAANQLLSREHLPEHPVVVGPALGLDSMHSFGIADRRRVVQAPPKLLVPDRHADTQWLKQA